jgi:hypothetical protein
VTAKTGLPGSAASAPRWLTPQPVIIAQMQNTTNTPTSTSEMIIASGTLRRGRCVSSATGATDSNPVKVKMARITPTNRLLPGGAFAGENTPAVIPPGPGNSMACTLTASRMAISRPPRMSCARPVITMPR